MRAAAESARAALAAAAQPYPITWSFRVAFGLEGGSPVTLLVSADTEQRARSFAEEARRRIAPGPARVQWIGGNRIEDLIRVAQNSRAFLVGGAESPLFRGGGLERLLDAIDQPLHSLTMLADTDSVLSGERYVSGAAVASCSRSEVMWRYASIPLSIDSGNAGVDPARPWA